MCYYTRRLNCGVRNRWQIQLENLSPGWTLNKENPSLRCSVQAYSFAFYRVLFIDKRQQVALGDVVF